MSTEKIVGSGSIVPKYNKDKSYKTHLLIEHDEVFVNSNNNTKKFTHGALNPFEICIQKYQNHIVNKNYN
jgi:hypothetical protein